jgi:hypothetical protein
VSSSIRGNIALAVVLTIALLVTTPASAAPGWSPPVNLSGSGKSVSEPQIAVDAAGEAVAVWKRFDEQHSFIQAASRPPGGAWSAPTTISVSGKGPRSFELQLAMNAAGEAVAVWTHERDLDEDTTIQAASRSPAGSWSAPATISRSTGLAGAREAQVVISASGEAVAAWNQFHAVKAASRPPGGVWSRPASLSKGRGDTLFPQIAMNSAGEAIAIWESYGASGFADIVQAAARPPGGAWSGPANLSTARQEPTSPQVAIAASGEATVVWAREFFIAIQGVSRSPGGKWSSVRTLAKPNRHPLEVLGPEDPQVSFEPAGAPVAVWVREVAHSGLVVQTATGGLGGIWSKPTSISPRPLFAFEPQVALDAAGGAVVTWISRRGYGYDVIKSASRPPGGAWSPSMTISPKQGESRDVRLAANPAGAAVAIWQRADHGHSFIEAASLP